MLRINSFVLTTYYYFTRLRVPVERSVAAVEDDRQRSALVGRAWVRVGVGG